MQKPAARPTASEVARTIRHLFPRGHTFPDNFASGIMAESILSTSHKSLSTSGISPASAGSNRGTPLNDQLEKLPEALDGDGICPSGRLPKASRR